MPAACRIKRSVFRAHMSWGGYLVEQILEAGPASINDQL